MRNYIKLFYGVFNEHSDALHIDINLDILTGTIGEFQSRVAQYRMDILQAGGDWTGTLKSEMEIYFELSKDKFVSLLSHLGNPVNATTIPTLVSADLVSFDSPRSRERRKFYLVPIKKRRKA